MIHPNHQLNLAERYLKTLPESDLSVEYTRNTEPISFGLFSKIKIFFGVGSYYKDLTNFYPYHQVVTSAAKNYNEDINEAIETGLIISAVTSFGLFQFARRGFIAPVLRKYGKYFGTHRIFRQYLLALVLPTTILQTLANWEHFETAEQLWKVHARRMQNHVYADPQGSKYPENLLPFNMKGLWHLPSGIMLDRTKRLANQVKLSESSDYENPTFEAIDFGEDEVEAAEDEE